MRDLDQLLRNTDPLANHDESIFAEHTRLVARECALEPRPDSKRPRSRKLRAVVLGVALAVAAPTGAYVVADVLTAHTGRHARANQWTKDHSEMINTCAKDFPTVIMEYAPTDRPLPAKVTWQMIGDSLVDRMTDTCTSTEPDVAKGEPQTADNLRLNFEFEADTAWRVAWYRAVQRHDATAADKAITQVDATSRRPLVTVTQAEHKGAGGYNDRTVEAMRAGRVDDVITFGTDDPAWYKAVR